MKFLSRRNDGLHYARSITDARSVMRARSAVAQARWWALHHTRHALDLSLAAATPAVRHEIIRHLESTGAPLELDFSWPSRYRDDCLVDSHVVAPSAVVSIPPVESYATHAGHQWSELRVHRVKDVTIDSQTCLVFHGPRVLTASGHGWRSAADAAFLSGALDRVAHSKNIARLPGPLAPMGAIHNYGHFLLEAVPRALRVLQVEPDAVALFPGEVPDYAREILTALKIDHRTVSIQQPIASDDVLLCDPVPTGWSHPDDLKLVRDRVLERVTTTHASAHDRLFISRRGLSRAPSDATVLELHLESQGFLVVRPQNMSFSRQISLYRGASMVISDFGAGMSNTLFMEPGGTVCDLMTGEWWTPHFRQLAAAMGLTYRMIPLPATSEHPYGQAQDAVAAITEVLRTPF